MFKICEYGSCLIVVYPRQYLTKCCTCSIQLSLRTKRVRSSTAITQCPSIFIFASVSPINVKKTLLFFSFFFLCVLVFCFKASFLFLYLTSEGSFLPFSQGCL